MGRCNKGEIECTRDSKSQPIMGRMDNSAINQPLSSLLANDEASGNEADVVSMLASQLQEPADDDAFPMEKLKAKAVAEIDRILASKKVSDILGVGTKKEQRQEFHRMFHLLHPDKGLVSVDDARANHALRLAFAARQAISPSD